MIGARVAAVVVIVALCAAAGPAPGAPATSGREARRRFDEAEVAYKAGRYADALQKYQAGYAAMPLPGFLVNIAQCQRRLGDLKTARATYRAFVLVAPDSRLVPEVEALIRQLDAVIADLAAGGKGEAAAQVGAGGDVHTTELGTSPDLSPVPPEPAASPLVGTPAGAAPAATARPSDARWWIWGGIAAAAVAGGIAAGLALSSPESTTIHAGSLGTLRR